MKNRFITVIKVVISISLLAILFSRIDLNALRGQYLDIHFGLLGFAFAWLILQTAISSLKWMVVLRSGNNHLPFLFLWKTYLIGNFLSLFMPSTIGGDVYRIFTIKKRNHDLEESTSSVLFERGTGLLALISIALISSAFLPQNPTGYFILFLYPLLIIGFFLVTNGYFITRFEALKIKPAVFLSRLLASFQSYRKDLKRLSIVILLSFLFQFNVVFINKIYALGLGIDIPMRVLLVIIPIIYLIESIPISISGIGVRESAFATFFILAGQAPEEGLAIALLTVFLRYLLGGIGGILLLIDTLIHRRSVVISESRVETRDSP